MNCGRGQQAELSWARLLTPCLTGNMGRRGRTVDMAWVPFLQTPRAFGAGPRSPAGLQLPTLSLRTRALARTACSRRAGPGSVTSLPACLLPCRL